MQDLEEKLARARALSWEKHGKRITFFLPGMFSYNGLKGLYPAVSITGKACALQCDHCQGKTLEPMIPAQTGDALVETCTRLSERGNLGVLISGGCDRAGRLPWPTFIGAIREVKRKTNLYISIHCGLVDLETAFSLKAAGVDQALLDVIGDDETYRDIYHVDFGVERIAASLDALEKAHLPMVPHIVCGLHHGEMRSERQALAMISRHKVKQVVIVSLMRIPGTPAWRSPPLEVGEVASLIAETRLALPKTEVNLGCARQRGNSRLDVMAVDAGVNRMALPSEEAIARAREYGLEIRFQRTCCSVGLDFSGPTWSRS
jgi:uncharacterized radical SAM superfamily protein